MENVCFWKSIYACSEFNRLGTEIKVIKDKALKNWESKIQSKVISDLRIV